MTAHGRRLRPSTIPATRRRRRGLPGAGHAGHSGKAGHFFLNSGRPATRTADYPFGRGGQDQFFEIAATFATAVFKHRHRLYPPVYVLITRIRRKPPRRIGFFAVGKCQKIPMAGKKNLSQTGCRFRRRGEDQCPLPSGRRSTLISAIRWPSIRATMKRNGGLLMTFPGSGTPPTIS